MIVVWSGARFNSSAVNLVSCAGLPYYVIFWILFVAVLNTLTMEKFGGRDDGAGQPPKNVRFIQCRSFAEVFKVLHYQITPLQGPFPEDFPESTFAGWSDK